MSDPSKPDEVVDKPLVEPSQATVPAEDSKPSVQLDAEKIDSEKSTQSIPKVTIEETPQAAAPPHIEPVAATGPSVSFALTSDKKSEAVLPTVTAPKEPPTEPVPVKKEEKRNVNVTEHLMSIPDVASKFNVSIDEAKPASSIGLTSAEAAKRLEENGFNMLTPPTKRHPILKFLDCLLGLFNLILIFSGVASYVTVIIDLKANFQNVYLGGILIGVAFMNAAIEFIQGQKSQSILESFLNLIPANCYVVRDGKQQQISAKELVNGDVVLLKMGDKIPADVFIFASTELKVDNSSLTGESEPQERLKTNTYESPLEATNLAFNGTLCVNGDGYGIVIRTGDHTVIGQIASLTTNEQRRESPMSVEIDHFVHIIAGVAAVTAAIFFVVAMVGRGNTFSASLSFAIGTFVSFVPEGLPATVTMLLTIAAKRMASRKVLVKDLQGVETLGAITLLATDKTGTLTRNQMTVTYIWTGGSLYMAQGQLIPEDGFEPVALDANKPGPNEVLHMSALCSRAKFENTNVPIAERQVIGDATESGLLRCAAAKIPEFDSIHERHPKVFEIPFNSTNKWAMTIHQKRHSNGQLMLYIKGAPERILRLCSTIYDGEKPVTLTPEHKAQFESTYTYMASKGHRVLAFAALALPGDQYPADHEFKKEAGNYPTKDYTFYGLVSLEDPPKHGVREAIGHCRAAGIKVMMVTGDHPLTAEAIARKINLMLSDTRETLAKKRQCPPESIPESDARAIVIHGEMIDTLKEEDWVNIFDKDEIIFARTSPSHKLQIVKRAQARGHIVGVTGDGVNDSPALKKADLGIAMNESGSDVSKEAAAMILLDDNFASTVSGIEEGRLIFQNLKKSIQYTVTHTMPEVFANLLYIAVPLPLPLQTVQILIVDLGFELLMALTYAYDPAENKDGLMKLPPRKPVNPHSVELNDRRKELDREERKRYKPETKDGGEAGHEGDEDEANYEKSLTKFQKMDRGLRRMFDGKRWKLSMEKTDEETLVDTDLLSYSYLEAGTIETIGCFAAYFFAFWYHYRITPAIAVQHGTNFALEGYSTRVFGSDGRELLFDDQKKALGQAQSAFYLALMLQQSFNLFVCKARLGYPFGKFMFQNKYSFLGLFAGAALTFAMVYIPPLNVAFGTDYQLTPLSWLVGIGGGILLFLYVVLRTLLKKIFNPIKYADEVVGLQMFPTKWSTGR